MSAATINRLEPTLVELEISISPEEVEAARNRAFQELSRKAKIPGFRPGKAPRKVFEAQYGAEGIQERAIDTLARDAYAKAISDNNLEPVEAPNLELLPEEDGQPLKLRATVSVRPEINPHDYKGVELTAPANPVSDKDVEDALESLRREAGTLIPVDRPIEVGDIAHLDYEGTIDGQPFEGGHADNHPTEIREERFIPGFVNGLLGMRAGETKQFDAHFPEDYLKEDLRGKTATFTVHVHDVNVVEFPALDDNFARRLLNPASPVEEEPADAGTPEDASPEDAAATEDASADDATLEEATPPDVTAENITLDALRQDVRARLEAQAIQRIHRSLSGVLLDRLMKIHDFPLPEVMVDGEATAIAAEAKQYVTRAGLDWDDYLKKQNQTEENLAKEYRAEAERRVKVTLLLEAIAKQEHIEATTKDIEAEINSMSRQYGQPRQAILEMLRPNFSAMLAGIVRSKTVEWLLDQAKITQAPVEATAGETPSRIIVPGRERGKKPAKLIVP